MNNFPHYSNAVIHLCHQHSQCDMAIINQVHLVDEIGRDNCVWFRDINQIFEAIRKKGTLFFHWLVGFTVLPVYGHIIRWWLVAGLTHSAIRNWVTPRCFSVVDFCSMNSILFSHALPRQFDGALYQNLCSLLSMRVPTHTPIHNEVSNRIHRCLPTFSLSGIGKYTNGYVVTTFRNFFIWTHLLFFMSF